MGYSHGKKWNDEMIETKIREVMQTAKIEVFPTHSLMDDITGDKALSNAVSKHGGTKYWANKMGVETKPCESKMGYEYECECLNFLISNFGYDCEFTDPRYPYDLLINGCIKADVKCSNLYIGDCGRYYTFNLEKSKPTCDIYVCYCLNNEKVEKIYVIPSCVLSGKTQLSVGENKSKYDKYINGWEIFARYNTFYNQMIDKE